MHPQGPEMGYLLFLILLTDAKVKYVLDIWVLIFLRRMS